MPHLEQPFRFAEVFEIVLSEVHQPDVVGQSRSDDTLGAEREQGLLAMTDTEHSRAAIESGPEVVTVTFVGDTRVERHPNSECSDPAPVLRVERGVAH